MSIYEERRTYKPAAMDPSRPVSRDVIDSLLQAACWAPTHGLTQPWRFHVFDTPPSRAELAEGLTSIFDAVMPEAKRDPAKRAKLADGPLRAPVVIALLARIQPAGLIPEWEEIAAVSCAAQNLMLAAHERGIGSFWSTPPAACSAEFVSWLGADADHRAMGLIYLGYPLPGLALPASTRAPLEKHRFWHGASEDGHPAPITNH
ncbi:MAG: nitroreductase [Akkermansiaceae bacterium]|jgi:nitroreductase|nr:nitroreductase [Akkermansiaceae bacterium]